MKLGRVMITEDEGLVARDLENRLTSMGYEVTGVAATGEDALREAERNRPHLALMDIRLKGKIDGIQVAEYLRNQLNIPVIFITSYANDEFVQRAKEVIPHGYLIKPFSEKDLRVALQLAFHRQSKDEEKIRSVHRLASVVQDLDDAVVITDLLGKILMMNGRAERMSGIKCSDVVGDSVEKHFQFVEEESVKEEEAVLGLNGNKPPERYTESMCYLVTKEKLKIPVTVKISVIRKSGSDWGEILMQLQDRSRERELSNRLHIADDQLFYALDCCHGGIWDIHFLDNKIRASHGWYGMMELDDEHQIHHLSVFKDFIHEDDREAFATMLFRYFRGECPYFGLSHRIVTAKGHVQWVHSRGIAIQSAQGRLVRMVGVTLEIGDQAEMNKTVKKENAISPNRIYPEEESEKDGSMI